MEDRKEMPLSHECRHDQYEVNYHEIFFVPLTQLLKLQRDDIVTSRASRDVNRG